MMAASLPSRDGLFTSPFATASFSTPRSARRPSDPSFPLCTIQLLHHHTPHTLSYYSAPPHLPPNSPLFSHLLAAFSRSVEQLLGVQPVAYEGTDGLLYPPAVMLQLPDMMEGRSFKVVLPALPSAATSAVSTATDATAEPSSHRQRRKQKKSVSFGQLASPETALRARSTPTTSNASPSFSSTHPFNKHPLPISTSYHTAAQLSPLSPSPQSPVVSPLPPSLLVPSSFPLPSYTTSIPLLRSILSRAFLPSVTLAHMSVLFVHYASASSMLLPRSAFIPLVSTALRPTGPSSRSAAVLQCFLSHLFTWLDDDDDDQMSEPQFIAGMALLLPATTGAEKLAISFRLLDRQDTGFIAPAALFTAAVTFTRVLLSLSHPLASSTAASPSSAAIPFRSSFDVPSLIASTFEIAGKVVRESFGCGDANLDQRLSSDEYHTLHLSRPSCLPWVNVLIDPEAVTATPLAATILTVAPTIDAMQPGVDGQSSGHSRSASLPMRVDLTGMLRRRKEWDLHTTGHHDARKRLHEEVDNDDQDEEEEEAEEDDEEEEEDEAEAEREDENGEDEKADNEDGHDQVDEEEEEEEDEEASGEAGNPTARTQPAAEESEELEIDSVVQQKMLEFAMSQSGGSKRSGGRGGSGGQEAKQQAPTSSEVNERDTDDNERTEAFLEAMYDELRRAGLQPRTGADNKRTPTKPDTEQRSNKPYSLLLSATVTAPRLSSLCSSPSFQSIQPHVAPFAVLRLEQLLELFHLLTSHQDRLARADLARLTSTLSIGQSNASHATMLDTLHCLFTWSDQQHHTTHATTVSRGLIHIFEHPLPCTHSSAWHSFSVTCGCRFDTDEDDEIATADIVLALSAMVGSDGREQVNVGFALCDEDSDGRLTVVEVERYLVDVMGAFFCLTEQWNTLVRLTKQEQEERLNRKKAALLLQQQQQARKEAENKATASTELMTDQTAAVMAVEEKSQSPTDAQSSQPSDEQKQPLSQQPFNSSRPASPSFSLSTLRREVSSLLINAATTAASHCFTVHTHPPLDTGTSIDAQRLWEWMDAVRVEALDKERVASGLGGSRPSSSSGWRDRYPMFDVVKALYVLL